ncbi:hypothetical protein HDV00_006778 [Rhizophlyctis rosea]|nr:hypothetical protein HDV00_006778 [Rhizophlyctis rosea]
MFHQPQPPPKSLTKEQRQKEAKKVKMYEKEDDRWNDFVDYRWDPNDGNEKTKPQWAEQAEEHLARFREEYEKEQVSAGLMLKRIIPMTRLEWAMDYEQLMPSSQNMFLKIHQKQIHQLFNIALAPLKDGSTWNDCLTIGHTFTRAIRAIYLEVLLPIIRKRNELGDVKVTEKIKAAMVPKQCKLGQKPKRQDWQTDKPLIISKKKKDKVKVYTLAEYAENEDVAHALAVIEQVEAQENFRRARSRLLTVLRDQHIALASQCPPEHAQRFAVPGLLVDNDKYHVFLVAYVGHGFHAAKSPVRFTIPVLLNKKFQEKLYKLLIGERIFRNYTRIVDTPPEELNNVYTPITDPGSLEQLMVDYEDDPNLANIMIAKQMGLTVEGGSEYLGLIHGSDYNAESDDEEVDDAEVGFDDGVGQKRKLDDGTLENTNKRSKGNERDLSELDVPGNTDDEDGEDDPLAPLG